MISLRMKPCALCGRRLLPAKIVLGITAAKPKLRKTFSGSSSIGKYSLIPIHMAFLAYNKQFTIGVPFVEYFKRYKRTSIEKDQLIATIESFQVMRIGYLSMFIGSRRTSLGSTNLSAALTDTSVTPKRAFPRE